MRQRCGLSGGRSHITMRATFLQGSSTLNHDRRILLKAALSGVAAGAVAAAGAASPAQRAPIRALAFDALPIFDPRPIQALAQSLFPAEGAALMNAWRTRLFEYQWLRALGGHYADFMQTVRDSLDSSAAQLGLNIRQAERQQLVDAWSRLQVWPDAATSLKSLREAGQRLIFLSNMTVPMLRGGLRNAGIEDLFEHVVSTDQIRTYKPDPRAYQLGVDALGLPREQILFVAFAGWDAAGAKWFGYPTFWVNRLGQKREQLDATPDGEGPDLAALLQFVHGRVTPGASQLR